MKLYLNKIITACIISFLSISITLSSFAGNLCRNEKGELGVEAFCVVGCEENIEKCDHNCCSDFDFNDSESKKCSDIDISQSFLNKRTGNSPNVSTSQVNLIKDLNSFLTKDLNQYPYQFRNRHNINCISQTSRISTDILIC